jgi:adenylyltransferase/sulfurtransferase
MIEHLGPDELLRYSRHLALPEVGMGGQARLKGGSVLLVGAGGLGAPAALYLAAAGVGRLGLVDSDRVEASNLQRQVLYGDADVGHLKLEAAKKRLAELNPSTEVVTHPTRLGPENALDLVRGYEVVLDGTDSFATRYLVNDACVLAGVPDVFASISRFEGQASVLAAAGGPCYRCIFEAPPPPELVPSCAEGGVLGVLPGLLGIIQATEALKLLLGIGEPLIGRLLTVDALGMRFRTFRVEKNPDCPVCGRRAPSATLDIPTITCSSSPMASVPEISVRDFHRMRERGEPPFLLDVRRPDEYVVANMGGALIPLDELPGRIGELESHRGDELIVVHCRSGSRSARAVELLRQHGFTNVANLKGGILAWSEEVDPSVPRY